MSEDILILPNGRGLSLRLERNQEHGYVTAVLGRGHYPNWTELAFFTAHPRETARIHLYRHEIDGSDSLWFPSAIIKLSPTAAKRIAKWLAARGIGQPASAPPESGAADALDDLALNTDTPAPAAPGGAA